MKKAKKCTTCNVLLDSKNKKLINNSKCDKCFKFYHKEYRIKNTKNEKTKERDILASLGKKKCTGCKMNKYLSDFYPYKSGFLKVQSKCISCALQYDEKFQKKTRFRSDRDKTKKAYLYRKQYRIDNIDKARKYGREWRKNKRNEDPFYKIKMNLSSRISDIIRGKISRIRTMDLLSCTREEFIKHIEDQFTKGMNWGNYGKLGWHVDHIKPVSSYNLLNNNEMRDCWNYKNLQPLWWYDNLKKGNKI